MMALGHPLSSCGKIRLLKTGSKPLAARLPQGSPEDLYVLPGCTDWGSPRQIPD
jgi:hypothetical protein